MLQYESIPRTTLDVLNLLIKQPFIDDFYLVGGTALALYWGHRISIDIDYFTDRNIDLDKFEEKINQLENSRMDSKNPIGRIYTVKEVKCDFVNYPYRFLHPPAKQSDGLILAHIDDVVSLKLGAISNRGAKKDIYDLYFILQYYSIDQLVELYKRKYNVTDIFPLVKSLTYFGDAEEQLPPQLLLEKSLTWPHIKKTIVKKAKEFLH